MYLEAYMYKIGCLPQKDAGASSKHPFSRAKVVSFRGDLPQKMGFVREIPSGRDNTWNLRD